MTRFAYVADTHWGAAPMAYQQQKGYPDELPTILRGLTDYAAATGGIDFLLHGGDLVDAATDENIQRAAELLDLPFPAYLCLGNHDLTTLDAAGRWLTLAPGLFIDGSTDFTINCDDCRIHVVPTQWSDQPLFWDGPQQPHFSTEQTDRLTHELTARTDLPHLLLTHSCVFGLPVEQTGFDEPHHCPTAEFTAEVTKLVARYPSIECVLGAHNHLNMHIEHNRVDFLTASSWVETPFECKLFEVTPSRIEMKTVSLGPILDSKEAYDESKPYVQGRPVDRTISRPTNQ